MARAPKKAPAAKPAKRPKPKTKAAPAEAPDVFDQAIAAQEPQPAEPVPPAEPPTAGFAARITRPDPFGERTIALCDDNDGPKARLYRNQRFRQMAIQFDEKPDDEIREKLRNDGWTWRPAEGAWTKQLGERAGETHGQAQALFESIANQIRRANGREPVTSMARSR